MGNLDDSLSKLAKKYGIERQLESSDVVEKATVEIAKFIPREDFEVVSYKDGVLKIWTNSSASANEVKIKATGKLNRIVGDKLRVIFTTRSDFNRHPG